MKRAPNNTGRVHKKGYRVFGRTWGTELEHHVIVEKALGRPLKHPEEVHHFNEDKADNRPGNLIVCPDRKYHALLHKRQRAMEACGNPDYRQCCYCRAWDEPHNLIIRDNDSHVFHAPCRREYARPIWRRYDAKRYAK